MKKADAEMYRLFLCLRVFNEIDLIKKSKLNLSILI